MLSLRSHSLKQNIQAIKKHLPVVSEPLYRIKREGSTYEHFLKYGHGGRNSFNGIVATVFGGTGFLGRYVINRLACTGTQIIVPYRGVEDDLRHLRLLGELGQIVFVNYNLKDEESVAKTLIHSNVAVNLIGRDYHTRNFTFHECLVKGSNTIARLAKEKGVKRLVHVSALNAKGDSNSAFLQAKSQGERTVREIYSDATIIRPAEFYGHEDKFFNRYADRRTIPMGVPIARQGWSTKKRPVYVGDVAQGIVQSVKDDSTSGKIFELYGPEEYYLNDLVEFIFRIQRRTHRAFPIPMALFKMRGFLDEHSIFNPTTTRDMVIREYMSDEITDDAYTFEDLGIEPVNVNAAALGGLRRHRAHFQADEILDSEYDVCTPASERS